MDQAINYAAQATQRHADVRSRWMDLLGRPSAILRSVPGVPVLLEAAAPRMPVLGLRLLLGGLA